MSDGPHVAYLNLLNIFAYGTYKDYIGTNLILSMYVLAISSPHSHLDCILKITSISEFINNPSVIKF